MGATPTTPTWELLMHAFTRKPSPLCAAIDADGRLDVGMLLAGHRALFGTARMDGDNPPADDPPDTPPADTGKGFPADTKVEDMKPEEQAAYWKHQSRKHEDRAKPFKDMKPDEVKAWKQKAADFDALAEASQTEHERELAEAKKTAREEALAEVAESTAIERVQAEFVRQLPKELEDDDVEEILDTLDLAKFLDADKKVDTDKVKKAVERINPSDTDDGNPGPDLGQGRRGKGAKPSVASGADRYQARRGKKKTS